MPVPGHDPADVARRGEETDGFDVRALVEPEHAGESLVLDVETGDDEIDGLRCILRIGYP